MKFLLDQGVAGSTAQLLSAAGHPAIHVSELAMSRSADTQILAKAVELDSCIVTFDTDFHRHLAQAAAKSPSVIRLRLQHLQGQDVAKIVLEVIQKCLNDLSRGAAITVDANRIRVRRLPLA